MKMWGDRVKMETYPDCSGPTGGGAAGEVGGELQGNLLLVLTGQAGWLFLPSEQTPDLTPDWANVSSGWSEGALHGGGGARAEW